MEKDEKKLDENDSNLFFFDKKMIQISFLILSKALELRNENVAVERNN